MKSYVFNITFEFLSSIINDTKSNKFNNISSEENNNNEDDNNNIIDYSINNDNNKSNVIKPVVQFNEDDFKPYDEIVIPTLRKKNNSSFDLKKEYNLDDNGNDNYNSNNNNIK